MKSIIILIFLIGISMVLVGYTRQYTFCPNPRIEYRYIPRTFFDEQLSSGNVLKQFSSMFEQQNPWIIDRNIQTNENMDNKNFYKSVHE